MKLDERSLAAKHLVSAEWPASRRSGRWGKTIRRNLPDRKPLLWQNLTRAARRRVNFALRSRLDAGWLDRARVTRLSDYGLRMEIIPRDIIGRSLYIYGMWEISGARFVQTLLRPGMTFLDIGANTGYYSLLASRLVGIAGAVHSFEPADAIRARLARNVAINRLTNVQVHPEAVTNTSGKTRFYVGTSADNHGISSILPDPRRKESAELVPTICLDEFRLRLPERRIDLMKIDVEGAEPAVLEGAKSLLSEPGAPALLFESYDVVEVAGMLEALGFTVRRLRYSLSEGFEFLDVSSTLGKRFEAAYEMPNYVALKVGERFGSFATLADQHKKKLPKAWRLFLT